MPQRGLNTAAAFAGDNPSRAGDWGGFLGNPQARVEKSSNSHRRTTLLLTLLLFVTWGLLGAFSPAMVFKN